MADVNTYKRAIATFASAGTVVHIGDVRAASDPVVTANPQWWVALVDADFTTPDGKKNHSW